jgi:hypothetical protein
MTFVHSVQKWTIASEERDSYRPADIDAGGPADHFSYVITINLEAFQ